MFVGLGWGRTSGGAVFPELVSPAVISSPGTHRRFTNPRFLTQDGRKTGAIFAGPLLPVGIEGGGHGSGMLRSQGGAPFDGAALPKGSLAFR